MTDKYESPLASRYASDYMLGLFSADTRFQTWRRLWCALAREEMALGLPITEEQVRELEAHITDIDYATIRAREKEVRHDVMAHVYAYGKAAPSAAGVIHLGATSCSVTDNADLIAGIKKFIAVFSFIDILCLIWIIGIVSKKYKISVIYQLLF